MASKDGTKDQNPTRHLDDILQEYKDRAAEASRSKAGLGRGDLSHKIQ